MSSRGISWLLGVALLFVVIVASLHVSEGREFVRLVERASPWWLLSALVFQAGTYLAQAEVFASVPRAAGVRLPRRWLYRLSLTKLFMDQALPPAGVSSTVVVAEAFRRRGVSRDVTAATAIVNIASYHAALVVALLVALGLAARFVPASGFVLMGAAVLVVLVVALTITLLALSGRRTKEALPLRRLPIVRGVLDFIQDANPKLTRDSWLLGQATGWQIAIFLLDAATLWALIRSLGATAGAGGVFASYMISSLFRIIGIVPGGLGTYEATSVLTLRMIGVSVPVALSATLIFRGLSFWLPMLPGWWFSRHVTGRTG